MDFFAMLLLVFFSYVIFQCFGFNFFWGLVGVIHNCNLFPVSVRSHSHKSQESGVRTQWRNRRPAVANAMHAACCLRHIESRERAQTIPAVHYEVASFSSPGLRTIVRRTCQLLDRSLPRRLRTSSIQSAHQLARHHVPTDT